MSDEHAISQTIEKSPEPKKDEKPTPQTP